MDKESIKNIFALKTTRRDTTNSAYATRMMSVAKKYKAYKGNDENFTSFDFLKDVEDVMLFITTTPNSRKDKNGEYGLPSNTTQIGMINPISEYCLAINEHILANEYLKYKNVIDDKIKSTYQKNGGITNIQKENIISYEDLVTYTYKIDSEIKIYEDKPLKTFTEVWMLNDLKAVKILMRLYLLHPSRNEYAGLKFITLRDYRKLKQPEYNYVVIGQKFSYLSITNYKTSGKYGLKLSQITDKPLLKMLKSLKNVRDFEEKENLFYLQKTGMPWDNYNLCNILTKFSKKYMDGKSIGSTLIYKIVIAEAGLNYNEALENDDIVNAIKFNEILAKYARSRGHSQKVQKDFYIA